MEKILIIDDNRNNLISLQALISEVFPDARILKADNGKAGLELAEQEDPDVILLGILMPGMDGFDVCRRLKADIMLKDIPVVFITAGGSDRESRIRALEVGADGFLTKPVNEVELTAQIRAMVRLKSISTENREKLRASDLIFNHSIDMLCIAGFDGYFKVLNPSWSKILGWSTEELLARPWNDFVHPDDVKATDQIKSVIVDGEEISQFENRYLCKDGSYKWLSWNSFPYPGEGIMFGVARDITAQRKTEKAYQSLFHEMLDGFALHEIILNEDGKPVDYRFLNINPAFEKMTGLSAKNIIGKRVLEVLPDTEKYWIETYGKVALTGEPCHLENYSRELKKYYEVKAFSPAPHHFVTIVADITARRESEQKLAEEHNRLSFIMEATKTHFDILDGDFNILYVDPSWQKVYGDFEGRKCYEYFMGSKEICPGCGVHQALTSKEVVVYEEYLHKENRHIAVHTIPYQTDQGDWLVAEFNIDITDRKAAEQAIIASEERFRLLVKNSSDIIVMISPEGLQTYVSPAAKRITGYDPEELMGKNISEVIHPDDIEVVQQAWEKTVENPDNLYSGQYRHIHKTKGWVYLEAIGQSFLHEPAVEAVVASVRDVSGAKHEELIKQIQYTIARSIVTVSAVEDFLEILRKELGRVLDTSNFMVALYNPDTDTLKKLVYRDEKDDFGEWPANKSISGYVVKQGKPVLMNRSEIEAFSQEQHIELIGTPAACWLGVPITIKDEVAGAMVIQSYTDTDAYDIADISMLEMVAHETGIFLERQKMLDDLIKAKEKAEESDHLKTAFLQNISHEIRTPLNGILGFGRLWVESDLTPEEKGAYYAIVQRSSDRLMSTVTDFVDMARVVSGTMTVTLSEINVVSAIQDILDAVHDQCREKHLEFDSLFPPDAEGLVIRTDVELVRRIIRELTDNAIKFTDQGKITIGFDKDDHFLRFFVRDTGKGIAPGKQEMIFDMFNQEEIAITRGHEGSGLGLSIIRGFVELLGGSIWVESEKGMGSTFWFTLPFMEDILIREQEKPVKSAVPVTDRPLILVAEDDESNFQYMEVVFRKSGCDILHATNGAEAVDMCRNNPEITFILMDIKMPVLNGLEATRLIREFRPGIPVIALTAYALTGDEQRILDAGCDAYWPKPIQPDVLKTLVRKYT